MRILVIGGNGFIGVPLVHELSHGGHKIAILRRHAGPADFGPDVVVIQGDRNRLPEYRARLQQFAPDVIIDLILSSGEQARQLMQTVAGIAQRVVAVSSMDVYRAWGVLHGVEPGRLEPLPLKETSALRTTRHLYSPEAVKSMQGIFTWLTDDYDKVTVEEVIASDPSIPATILRLPMVYGPGDPLHRFFPLLKRLIDERPSIILSADFAAWRGPRGYVENVAHAIAVAATSEVAAGRVYNVCEEPCYSELDWQLMIAKQAGWSGKFVVLPTDQTPKHLLLPGNTAQHIVASSELIRAELNYSEVIGIDQAMQRTIDWEQQHPPSTINQQQFDYDAEDAALETAA